MGRKAGKSKLRPTSAQVLINEPDSSLLLFQKVCCVGPGHVLFFFC